MAKHVAYCKLEDMILRPWQAEALSKVMDHTPVARRIYWFEGYKCGEGKDAFGQGIDQNHPMGCF